MRTLLLPTAYWPNLLYFYHLFNENEIVADDLDEYERQTYRNRTRILTANGVLDLSIPVKKTKSTSIKDIHISYAETWQQKHHRAIESAYRSSPYFEFFEEDIGALYQKRYESLFEFNQDQLLCVWKILRIKKQIYLHSQINLSVQMEDMKHIIQPSHLVKKSDEASLCLNTPYRQVFKEKFGFVANLSILDLLFCKGLHTVKHLKIENQEK